MDTTDADRTAGVGKEQPGVDADPSDGDKDEVEETDMDTTDAYGNPIQSGTIRGIGMKTN